MTTTIAPLKRASLALGLLTAILISSGCVTPWGIAPVGGFNLDNDELFLGADAWIPIEQDAVDAELVFAPALAWYPFLGSDNVISSVDASLFGAYADVAASFVTQSSFEPFVRGGLGIYRSSVDVSGVGDTDLKLHLAAGGHFGEPGTNRPFAQIGIALGDGSALYLAGGYRFMVSRE